MNVKRAYERDRTCGHREFWRAIRAEVQAEQTRQTAEVSAVVPVDIDSLSVEELERLTAPTPETQEQSR
jgi:hypothetical protein